MAGMLARYEALLSQHVTNPYHQIITLNALAWQLLPFVDGTRTVDELVEVVVADGTVVMEEDGQPLKDEAARRRAAAQRVPPVLETLRGAALLMEN